MVVLNQRSVVQDNLIWFTLKAGMLRFYINVSHLAEHQLYAKNPTASLAEEKQGQEC